MARKTLDSTSKRKAEEDVKKAADPTGDEVLSSMVTNKKIIETTGSNKKPKTSKIPEDSSRKLDDSKKKVKKADKKVKFESPVKRSGKKDDVEVKRVKKTTVKKEEVANGALYAFPMNRVTRIVKSENPDVKLSAEAAFLFNKASEKFLELFSKEAYACAFKDGRKKIEYQHLASLIPGNTKFDFLSDFVPAKVKVADALKKIPSVET